MPTMLVRRTALAGAATLTFAATTYLVSIAGTSAPASEQGQPARTLSFPRTMLRPRHLTVVDVQQLRDDTKKIIFELPGGLNEISGVEPGGAVMTEHTPEGAWLPIFRPYTPIHGLDKRGAFELMVKKYPGGRASTHLHSLVPGQQLKVWSSKPGHWTTPKDQRDILLIAGGAGIAPIYSLAKGVLSNPGDKTRIQLLWGVSSVEDIVLKEELEDLETQHPGRLHVTYVVSDLGVGEGVMTQDSQQKYRKGHVDKSLVQEAVNRCKKGTWGDEKGQRVFLCGPPGMEDALAGKYGMLRELGISKKEIHRF